MIQKTINKKWNLTQFLQEASQIEDVNRQVREMKTEPRVVENIGRVENRKTPNYRPQRTRSTNRKQNQPREKSKQSKCRNCGYDHSKQDHCPAFGKRCNKCNKWNHFGAVCQSSSDKTQYRPKPEYRGKDYANKKRIKRAEEKEDSTSSDDEYFEKAVKSSLSAKNISDTGNDKKTITVILDDVDMKAEPDSGADVNLMDEHQFKTLSNRTKNKITLKPSKARLNTLQHELKVKGEFSTIIRNQTCGKEARFIVVYGRIHSPPLVCRDSLIQLGMMKIQQDGGLTTSNDMRIPDDNKCIGTVKQQKEEKEMMDILDKYKHIFEGIGKIYDHKNNREMQGKFTMKPEAAPVAQKPRQVPYYLQTPFKEWLEQGVEEDIFEKVPENEPITWCFPVVVQPKPSFSNTEKGQLKPHMIRASVDLRVPNKYMERSRITQPPVVEDFVHKFHDCTIWTKLDLRQGYHQLELDPESRSVATFSTPWGNYRPQTTGFWSKSVPGPIRPHDAENLWRHTRMLKPER